MVPEPTFSQMCMDKEKEGSDASSDMEDKSPIRKTTIKKDGPKLGKL